MGKYTQTDGRLMTVTVGGSRGQWVFVFSLFILAAVVGAIVHAMLFPRMDYADCGMCDAHVSEWWYVQGADGSPCEVCDYCYLICLD